jgi:N-acetylglucosamine malate deacetylase 1
MNLELPPILQSAKIICIVAPHQDDEVLGLGGSLSKLLQAGKEVHVLFTTDGGRGIKHVPGFIAKQVRAQEFAEVNKFLGGKLKVSFFKLPDGDLAKHENKCLELLKAAFEQLKPDLVFAPNPADWHSDHKASFEITIKALKSQPNLDAQLLIYEVWSPLLEPNILVNITEEAQLKRQLIRLYQSQVKQMDFESCIMGLNAYRSIKLSKKMRIAGKQNFVEAFSIVK